MNRPLFTGVCTALITPFQHGKINYPMLEVLLQRQMDQAVRTVVVAGTTGEAPTLSDAEKLELFRRTKEYTKNNMLVIAGTGSNCTSHTVELSIEAEKVGADALLVVSPYYNKATPDGLIAHYSAIANAVSIPVIVYNVPSRTGLDIPAEVYRQLSKIQNIVGVKEASADITKITKIRAACGPEFSVWTGNDEMITPAISLGAEGVISVVSNALPAEIVSLTDAAMAGDRRNASAMQIRWQPLISAFFREVNPIPVKAAMKLLGYDCGNCRLPLTPLTKENEEYLKGLLEI